MSIIYFEDNEDFERHCQGYWYRPVTCPVCKFSIEPSYFLMNSIIEEPFVDKREVLCKCPRKRCSSLYIAVYEWTKPPYQSSKDHMAYVLGEVYPKSREVESFSKEITDLSGQFVEVYNQACIAEQENLNLISGVGYRKALEFLVKDYAISLHSDQEERIKKKLLGQCIQDYINHVKTKAMAERAVWLGNDETHYERKWVEKDIEDLKNLITLTVHYIEMELLSSQYQTDMATGRR